MSPSTNQTNKQTNKIVTRTQKENKKKMEASSPIQSTLVFLLLVLLPLIISATPPGTATTATTSSEARRQQHYSSDFIRASCKSTRYPALCEHCLSSFAPTVRHSSRQLAHAALSVSAARARDASSFVLRLSSSSSSSGGGPRSKSPRSSGSKPPLGAVHDCLETLADSVDRLHGSVKELSRMGRVGTARFAWHLSNVQTWVSAALTDESTCLDSLAEDAKSTNASARAQIRKRIVEVAQVTSNALALVNRLQKKNCTGAFCR